MISQEPGPGRTTVRTVSYADEILQIGEPLVNDVGNHIETASEFQRRLGIEDCYVYMSHCPICHKETYHASRLKPKKRAWCTRCGEIDGP